MVRFQLPLAALLHEVDALADGSALRRDDSKLRIVDTDKLMLRALAATEPRRLEAELHGRKVLTYLHYLLTFGPFDGRLVDGAFVTARTFGGNRKMARRANRIGVKPFHG